MITVFGSLKREFSTLARLLEADCSKKFEKPKQGVSL